MARGFNPQEGEVNLSYRIWILLTVGLLGLPAASAGAQVPLDSVAAHARIRIRAAEAGIVRRTVPVFDSVVGDVVFVHELREPRALRDSLIGIPLHQVTRFDVSRGRKSRWSRAGRGALWGLAAYGVLAGAYIVHEKATCEYGCFGDGFAWIGLAGAVPWAAGLGASVGFALPVETWRSVDIPRRR